MLSPLEQFSLDFGIVFTSLIVSIDVALPSFINASLNNSGYKSRKGSSSSLGTSFIKGLLSEIVGVKGYGLVVNCIFTTIVITNFIGFVIGSGTGTSNISLTSFFSFSIIFGVTFIGLLKNGLAFFKLFMPSGAPKALIPFLIVIEVVSYLFRILSLSIRLFANITAGHVLIHILTGFIWTFYQFESASLQSGIAITLLSALVVILGFMEFAIGFLQAYVFIILTCIYLNEAIHLH